METELSFLAGMGIACLFWAGMFLVRKLLAGKPRNEPFRVDLDGVGWTPVTEPYLIEVPAPDRNGVSSWHGAKVFTPDGTELTGILGLGVNCEMNGFPVAYIKVPVHVGHR